MGEVVIPLTRLDLRFEAAPWPFAIARRAEIDGHFANARIAKPEMWNGRLLLLRSLTIENGVLGGTYLETDFASLLAWRDFGFPDQTIFNCFGMAALQSADGGYLLGEMAPHTANAGRVYFPAGTPEPADIVDGTVDLIGNVTRELLEETGLAARDLAIGEGWTCVRTGPRIALMKAMRAREDAEPLRRRILDHLAQEEQPELSDIRIVRSPRDVDGQMPPWITAYFRFLWG